MLRIGQVEATATQDGKYTDGSVAGGIAATRLRAAAFNAMQEELAHIVESAGLALDINDMTQVLKAIQKLTLSRINPFADIKSDGAAAISTALANLGLGIRGLSTFTASGSWTCPEGVTTVYIDACGGGGGGAYSSPGATGGGGGGGAAAVIGASISVTPGVTYPVTIGGPGAAGTSSSVNGVAGGATSFGSLLVLNGGGGGLSSAGAGAGGGTGGNAGTAGALNGGVSFGGSGGGCVLGNGGAGGNGAMFGTIPGQYGGGGGGGANGGSGARGAYGILKLRW